ncbi:MAG TPA: HEAT repeat domain-containing protein [Longimicrobium sp.]|nr:HEAT repeat domain-containing protein [Longimicrobium sp.]
MQTTPVPPADPGAFSPQPHPARHDVQEVVRGLGKALRAHLLYEGSGPALDRLMEGLVERFGQLWQSLTHLPLQVEEREIAWEGAPVLQAEERDGLPFLLYKDGIRELSLHPGFEQADLAAFIDVLARVQRVRNDEEDLLTLMWERDWEALRYRYVEVLADGVVLPQTSGAELAPVPAETRAADPSPAATVSAEDFRESLYFLDEGEMRRLQADLRREMGRDLWDGVTDALFDRLQDGADDRQERVVEVLSDLLPTLLASGRLAQATRLLGELVNVATGGRPLHPRVTRALRGLFEQLGQPATLAELVRTVEEAGGGVSAEELGALLGYFPPDALRPLLHASGTAAGTPTRQALLQAAERLARANPAALRALAQDADEAVAAGAARLAGRLRVAEAAPELTALLGRPQPALRLAAVEALQELRSPLASGALQRALDDGDRDVRVAAVRALAALGYTPAKAPVEAALHSRRLAEADLTERIAFFEAYGALAGPAGITLLERVLNGKRWGGRRESPETRACAARGLGRIRHPNAERLLSAAAADPEPVVKAAAVQALRAQRGAA